jgi:hypothetical protein
MTVRYTAIQNIPKDHNYHKARGITMLIVRATGFLLLAKTGPFSRLKYNRNKLILCPHLLQCRLHCWNHHHGLPNTILASSSSMPFFLANSSWSSIAYQPSCFSGANIITTFFVNMDGRDQKYTRAKCYETFGIGNLLLLVINWRICPLEALPVKTDI